MSGIYSFGFKRLLLLLLGGGLLAVAGCGGDSSSGLSNPDPGDNDINKIIAFGDSLTAGTSSRYAPYPAQLAGMTGKTVANEGRGGSNATDNIGRTSTVIRRHKGAFMIIFYGINDVLHRRPRDSILSALEDMINICKNNQVVPVIATYPIPIGKRQLYAGGTRRLNEGIRNLAATYNIRCVDLEREFMLGGEPDEALYDQDGLHFNEAGTHVAAVAFASLF